MGVEIIPATAARMAEIQAWLVVEQTAYDAAAAAFESRRDPDVELPERGFLCNWHLVQRSFAKDSNNVHILIVDGAAVGFLDEMDILEVRPDQRGKGYGRLLAEFMIEWAFGQGHSVVQI